MNESPGGDIPRSIDHAVNDGMLGRELYHFNIGTAWLLAHVSPIFSKSEAIS